MFFFNLNLVTTELPPLHRGGKFAAEYCVDVMVRRIEVGMCNRLL